jgi:hypothetical protein
MGDPVYEDIGLTPRFVELTRKFKKTLEATPSREIALTSRPRLTLPSRGGDTPAMSTAPHPSQSLVVAHSP